MKTKLKLIALLGFMLMSLSTVLGQQKESQPEKFRLIAGVRVNPLVIYDFEGHVANKTLLHAELGALFKKKYYTSLGYTAAVNALYNFNEYWFIGFDKKLPVSWVVAEEYNFNNENLYIQSGFNFKISKIGNVFAFLFTPTDYFDLGLKVGVFIPLNFVITQK